MAVGGKHRAVNGVGVSFECFVKPGLPVAEEVMHDAAHTRLGAPAQRRIVGGLVGEAGEVPGKGVVGFGFGECEGCQAVRLGAAVGAVFFVVYGLADAGHGAAYAVRALRAQRQRRLAVLACAVVVAGIQRGAGFFEHCPAKSGLLGACGGAAETKEECDEVFHVGIIFCDAGVFLGIERCVTSPGLRPPPPKGDRRCACVWVEVEEVIVCCQWMYLYVFLKLNSQSPFRCLWQHSFAGRGACPPLEGVAAGRGRSSTAQSRIHHKYPIPSIASKHE